MIKVCDGVPSKYCTELQNFLNVVDGDFVPPLYTRFCFEDAEFNLENVSTKQIYAELQSNLNFFLFEGSELVAWASVKLDYQNSQLPNWKDPAFLSCIAVSPACRKTGCAQRLYNEIQKELKVRNKSGLITRTWGSNTPHIHTLEKQGWVEINRLFNHRHPQEDTVYFGVLL